MVAFVRPKLWSGISEKKTDGIHTQLHTSSLYVKGSLRNTDTGMEFQILNKLGSGQARRLLPLTVDGEELP